MPARISAPSEVALPPDTDAPAAAPPSDAQNTVSGFFDGPMSSVGEDALENIEHAHRFYSEPEKINAQLERLGGPDLKHALTALQQQGQLAGVIDELSPGQRQALLDQAKAGGLISRQGLTGGLTANVPVAPDFQRLLDDVNAMGPKRTQELHYHWGPSETLDATAARAVRNLQPGDSVRLSGQTAIVVEGLKYGGGAGVDVQRDKDGRFRVGLDVEVGGGVEAELGPRGRAGATMNGKARVEYAYGTADEATTAAWSLLATQGKSVAALGKPAAVEGEASVVAEVMAELGLGKASIAAVQHEEKAATGVRLELDKKDPELVFRSSLKTELSGNLGLGASGHEKWAFLNGGGASLGAKVEVEQRFTLSGDALIAGAKSKATVSLEGTGLSETELSFEAKQTDIAAFAGRVALGQTSEAFATLGDQVELEVTQKHTEVTGHTLGGFAEHGGFGAGAELNVEQRKLGSERQLFKGSARELFGEK